MNKSIMFQLSEELKGEFIPRKYDEQEKMKVSFDGFEIVFDYDVNFTNSSNRAYTRIILPFRSENNFQFEIYPSSFLSKIAKKIGFIKDIEIGRNEFDSKFVVKSNEEFKIKSFLNDSKLRESLYKIKNFKFSVSKDKGIWGGKLPEKQYELSFFTTGTITEIKEFCSLFELFKNSIKQLKEINAIVPQSYTHKYK